MKKTLDSLISSHNVRSARVFLKQVVLSNNVSFLHKSHCRYLSAFNSKKVENKLSSRLSTVNLFHTNFIACSDDKKGSLVGFTEFEKTQNKNKKTFLENVKLYQANFTNKAGHVDFIKRALQNMKDFGIEKDLECYKKLLGVLPKGPYVADNQILNEFMYFPREQFAVTEVLQQMEDNGVIVDLELGEILKSIFGKLAQPCKKYYRMLYWQTKFKNKSPWPLPSPLPNDAYLLGKLAIEKITSVDIQTQVTTFQTKDVPNSLDKTWIVSGQSPTQVELLKNHSPETPVIVEGSDVVWLGDKNVNYFVLKADTEPYPVSPPSDLDDFSKMESIYFNPNYVDESKTLSVHEQDDGIIYAVCATGTSSKDSLLSWIRLLQENGNPILADLPVLFRFRQPEMSPAIFSEALVTRERSTE